MNTFAAEQSTLISDYKRFKNEPSVESRAALVRRISNQFMSDEFNATEKEVAIDILDVLSYDVEKNIRYTIAYELRNCSALPHDIALRLAHDIEEVSSPILEFSEVLTDSDLGEIIHSAQDASKISAIAKRKYVSPEISSKIVDTKHLQAIGTLLKNTGADINDSTFENVLHMPDAPESLLNLMVERGGLQESIAAKLITMVSKELQEALIHQYNIPAETATQLTQSAEERETLRVTEHHKDDESTIRLVDHLFETGKLNHSILLRALCKTDTLFFISGLARLAGIPISNAKTLVAKGDLKAFEALFTAAAMPSSMMEATNILLKIFKDTPKAPEESSVDYSRFLIKQIVKNQYDRDIPNMRYFLTLIGNNTTPTIQDSASAS